MPLELAQLNSTELLYIALHGQFQPWPLGMPWTWTTMILFDDIARAANVKRSVSSADVSGDAVERFSRRRLLRGNGGLTVLFRTWTWTMLSFPLCACCLGYPWPWLIYFLTGLVVRQYPRMWVLWFQVANKVAMELPEMYSWLVPRMQGAPRRMDWERGTTGTTGTSTALWVLLWRVKSWTTWGCRVWSLRDVSNHRSTIQMYQLWRCEPVPDMLQKALGGAQARAPLFCNEAAWGAIRCHWKAEGEEEAGERETGKDGETEGGRERNERNEISKTPSADSGRARSCAAVRKSTHDGGYGRQRTAPVRDVCDRLSHGTFVLTDPFCTTCAANWCTRSGIEVTGEVAKYWPGV